MAAGFLESAAVNTVGNLATEYTSPYLSHFLRHGQIVKDFKLVLNGLELKVGRVKNDVDAAIRQTEVIEKDVKDWLTRAEKELGEAQSLDEEIERKKCFNWCPNWGWRYCLSKRVANKTLSISKLLETSDFPRVGYRLPLQGIELLQSKDFMPSESSNSTFEKIISTLNVDSVNMIGLYGTPGVGKTTLAKEVLKHAEKQKLFDKVVMVTMSQTPNFNKFRDRIAELLGLKFEAHTDEGKAEELLRAMKGVERIFIIIDDVWNEFDLDTIGVPLGVQHKGCKIILTTRHYKVCVKMNCQENFQLDILSEKEAWDLLKDNAGLQDDYSTLNDVAKDVARECKGLPLAIVTVGKALKGATLGEWRVANQRFKDSRHLDNEYVCGVFDCLKLSYDYLKGHNIRSCFLLCSLFPEDCEIDVGWLTWLAIGEGLFSDIYSLNNLRREIHEALRKLYGCGLLLKNDDDDDELNVKMHDVIRDFAHWITSTGENRFMVKDELTEWPSISFECYVAISFRNGNVKNFPEKLEFSKLITFTFEGEQLTEIQSLFFEGMKALRVLCLTNVIFSLEACKFLRNLRILWFIESQLKNILSLKNMKNLEILAMLDTNINELPAEKELVAVLRRLKSLYLSYDGEEVINFPPNLLPSLTSLQELHVLTESNVNILELNSLSRLTALSLGVSTLPANFVFPKLQTYDISINENAELSEHHSSFMRTLEIDGRSCSLKAFEELFCNVKKLTLKNVREHKSIVPLVDQKGLNEVTYLHLKFCSDLECLVDTTGHMEEIRFLQKLKYVRIENCEELKVVFQTDGVLAENQTPTLSDLNCMEQRLLPNLKWIWKGPTHLVNLRSLKTMIIEKCDKLAYLFSTPLAQSLVNLEELVVENCKSLEYLIIEEAAESEDQIVLEVERQKENIVLQRLQILKLENLENLSSFCPENFVMSPSLKEFEVRHCPRLTRFGNRQGDALRANFKGLLCNAKKLTMDGVMSHENLIPNVDPEGLNELTFLTLKCGEGLECLIDTTDQGLVPTLTILSNLTSLELNSLPELKRIWKGSCHYISLQSLKVAKIDDCNRLKYLFSPSLAQSLVVLEELHISNCNGLEHIISTGLEVDDNIESGGGHDHHPSLFPKLTSLKILNCPRLEYVFKISLGQGFPHLKSLWISDAAQLKQVFKVAIERDGLDHAIAFPRLQYLRLRKLINLSCFCSENYPIVSPSLEKLEVEACPGLENFAIQQVNQEVQLKVLQLSKLENDIICDPINCQKIFQIEVGHFLSMTEGIYLDGINRLQGPIQVASLQYLRHLAVTNCNRLKSLFSSVLARNIPQLKSLRIERCWKLEEIIEMDQISIATSSQGHLQPISFPSLEKMWILGCRNLKSLFPISVIPSLSNLKNLSIRGASKLAQVFGYQGEPSVEHHQKEIVFPKLCSFHLSKLSSAKSLAPIGYHFHYPSLHYFNVVKCPMLTTSSSLDSKTPVHAMTEAPQQILNNTTEGFSTTEEIIDNQSICNDIIWFYYESPNPLYVTMGETKITIREKLVKNSEETF